MNASSSGLLRVEKAGAKLGAIIHGIDARTTLPAAAIAFLNAALVEHKVIFLRAQHVDEAQHEAFSRAFGTPVVHPTIAAPEGSQYTFELKSTNGRSTDSWHTDVTFVPAYAKASILRAIELPPYGGSTIWANTASAYADLPLPLQRLADAAWAIHANDYDTNYHRYDACDEEIADFRAAFISRVFETEHPVVRVHPESRERSLVLGHFVTGLRGFATRDANAIVEILQGYITRIENTVRWNWQPGDIAIWDNRSTQHYAPADFDTHDRRMRRITVEGDVPVGVDGRRSRAIIDGRPRHAGPRPNEGAD